MLFILAHDRWEQAMPSRMPTADAGSPSQTDSRQCALYTDSPLTKLGCRKGLGLSKQCRPLTPPWCALLQRRNAHSIFW